MMTFYIRPTYTLFAFNIVLALTFVESAVTQSNNQVYRLPKQHLNKCLNASLGDIGVNVTLQKCARICQIVTECQSLNYKLKGGVCQMFDRVAGTSEPLGPCPGYIHMTVSDWSQVRQMGQCSSKPCLQGHVCIPDGESSYLCDPLWDSEESSGTGSDGGGSTGSGTNSSEEGSGTGSDGGGSTGSGTTNDGSSQSEAGSDSSSSDQATTASNIRCRVHMLSGIDALPLTDVVFMASSQRSNSSLHNDYYSPEWAPLDTTADGSNHGSGWMAGINDDKQYIQVKFPRIFQIWGIYTKGYGGGAAWVKDYTVSYGTECENFTNYTHTGITVTFFGNTDSQTILRNMVTPFDASCIRLQPKSWHNHIGLRLDFMGCEK